VSREDVLRRGRGDLHQQGDADRDAGYSWGTGAIEDEGDRCLDSSYSLGSVQAGIELTERNSDTTPRDWCSKGARGLLTSRSNEE